VIVNLGEELLVLLVDAMILDIIGHIGVPLRDRTRVSRNPFYRKVQCHAATHLVVQIGRRRTGGDVSVQLHIVL
jgi:hypothetical protein